MQRLSELSENVEFRMGKHPSEEIEPVTVKAPARRGLLRNASGQAME